LNDSIDSANNWLDYYLIRFWTSVSPFIRMEVNGDVLVINCLYGNTRKVHHTIAWPLILFGIYYEKSRHFISEVRSQLLCIVGQIINSF